MVWWLNCVVFLVTQLYLLEVDDMVDTAGTLCKAAEVRFLFIVLIVDNYYELNILLDWIDLFSHIEYSS